MHRALGVESGQPGFGPETVQGHQLVGVIVQQNLADGLEGLLVSSSVARANEVETLWSVWYSVASREINTGNQLHLQPSTDKFREIILPVSSDFAEDDLAMTDC